MHFSLALRHRFPGMALDIAFTAEAGGITVLFGRSGVGKSTIIKAAAGLLRPDACRIELGDQVFVDTAAGIWLPPERRRVGLVFQDARLFPHMSVATNLRYGLRRAPPGGPIGFTEVVEMLGIAPLLDRRPGTLSGGERQRVAIGRALLSQPRLLLMDEPLASLDDPRKAEILPFLLRLKSAMALPILYVTHALNEVVALADTVVLLEDGRTSGQGPVTEMMARTDLALARRDDATAVLACRVRQHYPERGLTLLEAAGITLWVPLMDVPLDAPCRARIPAREVILAARPPEGISLHNVIPGTIRRITPEDTRRSVLVEIALPSGTMVSRVTTDAVDRLGLAVAGPVLALVKSTSIEVIRA